MTYFCKPTYFIFVKDTTERKKRKITPVRKYRHEGEPVGLVLITVFRDADLYPRVNTLLPLSMKTDSPPPLHGRGATL